MNSLLLSRVVEQDVFVAVLAKFYGVSPAEVFVGERDEDLVDAPPDSPVMVIQRTAEGEYPLWLEVFSRREPSSDAELAAAFVAECGVDALISDWTPNPYQWIRVCAPHARQVLVYVDADQLDDHNAFVVAGEVREL